MSDAIKAYKLCRPCLQALKLKDTIEFIHPVALAQAQYRIQYPGDDTVVRDKSRDN